VPDIKSAAATRGNGRHRGDARRAFIHNQPERWLKAGVNLRLSLLEFGKVGQGLLSFSFFELRFERFNIFFQRFDLALRFRQHRL